MSQLDAMYIDADARYVLDGDFMSVLRLTPVRQKLHLKDVPGKMYVQTHRIDDLYK